MRKVLLLLLLLVTLGCHGSTVDATGWIRSSYRGGERIIFETEDGRIFTFDFCDGDWAPVWQGMHVHIRVHRSHACDTFIQAEHLPPDAH